MGKEAVKYLQNSERENPHCGETNQHALTQTPFLWLTGFSFFHCVASPFHSFVTTHTDPMQPAGGEVRAMGTRFTRFVNFTASMSTSLLERRNGRCNEVLLTLCHAIARAYHYPESRAGSMQVVLC